jgi:hypothetical protein
LFGFNVGIEMGQVLVLACSAMLLGALDAGLGAVRSWSQTWPAYRVRVTAVSLAVVVIAARWAAERAPW